MAGCLLQLSERWPRHVWLVDGMKFASLEANLGGGQGPLVYPILLFTLPVSGRDEASTKKKYSSKY